MSSEIVLNFNKYVRDEKVDHQCSFEMIKQVLEVLQESNTLAVDVGDEVQTILYYYETLDNGEGFHNHMYVPDVKYKMYETDIAELDLYFRYDHIQSHWICIIRDRRESDLDKCFYAIVLNEEFNISKEPRSFALNMALRLKLVLWFGIDHEVKVFNLNKSKMIDYTQK